MPDAPGSRDITIINGAFRWSPEGSFRGIAGLRLVVGATSALPPTGFMNVPFHPVPSVQQAPCPSSIHAKCCLHRQASLNFAHCLGEPALLKPPAMILVGQEPLPGLCSIKVMGVVPILDDVHRSLRGAGS
jgi:hypothetical protein